MLRLQIGNEFRLNRSPSEPLLRSDVDFPIVNKERAWNIIDGMGPIVEAHECSPAQVALAWILSKLHKDRGDE
jgi:aryl-alcohol dehydrogenase-like predicted oxidoreductase